MGSDDADNFPPADASEPAASPDGSEHVSLRILRERVRVMRALGVVQWNGILLGPEPLPRSHEKQADTETEQERRRRIALGASSGLRRVRE